MKTYDSWKLAPPPEYDEESDGRCPHGEDGDCELCNEMVDEEDEPESIPGPNGCTCGFNGDCNCPYVGTAS